ncbi:MAG: hypothetical protein Q9183_004684 [Haloplaca sp. 2 TL-2023]
MLQDKISIILAFLSVSSLASPVANQQDYSKIHYPPGTGEDLPSYPKGTGENLPYYPPGTGENLPFYPGTSTPNPVFNFTSTYHIEATPDQVVNGTTPTGGLKGCHGIYDIGLISDINAICFSIKITGFRGEYQSAARTATHLHEAAKGQSGPPRVAFPNPEGKHEGERLSIGCLRGPFTTGLMMDGKDTGAEFHVGQIEHEPEQFMVDIHSSLAVPGAVRGQFPHKG